MHSDSLAAMVRAVARLRPRGALDPALVNALAELVAPTADHNTVEIDAPAGQGPDARDRRAAEPAQAPEIKNPPRVAHPSTTPDDDALPSVALRPAAPDPMKLVALVSTMVQMAERADLASPTRSPGASNNAEPGHGTDSQGPVDPLESLFPAGRVRAILRDMATISTPSGHIDIQAAVAMIARAEPVQSLPVQMKSSLGHTIQLLFDAGPSMLPFSRDKHQLAATALRLLGKDRVRVSDFIGDPGRGVRAQRQVRWEPLRWPGRGSTLLVVSDLGIAAGHTQEHEAHEAWAALLAEADQRGVRTLALIPYTRERWPAAAARFGVALTWDLATGVQLLRRATRSQR